MNNNKYTIAIGPSRFSKDWKNTEIEWDELARRCAQSIMTAETHSEYMDMPKDRQDTIKDIGGWVGGKLITDGPRRKENVEYRSILTLDLDDVTEDIWHKAQARLSPIAMFEYSTHKSTAEKPRLRLCIPLDQPIIIHKEYGTYKDKNGRIYHGTGENMFRAVVHKTAEIIGLVDSMDPASERPTQLMYWASHCSDQRPIWHSQPGEPLSVYEVLRFYGRNNEWMYSPGWAVPDGAPIIESRGNFEAIDPKTAAGLAGAFNRTYTVSEAIARFIPGVYERVFGNRYTYAGGESSGGLIVSNDERAYSFHQTDPAANGHSHTAYDLIRVHLFGDESDIPYRDRPSVWKMNTLCLNDPAVMRNRQSGKRTPQNTETKTTETNEGQGGQQLV